MGDVFSGLIVAVETWLGGSRSRAVMVARAAVVVAAAAAVMAVIVAVGYGVDLLVRSVT